MGQNTLGILDFGRDCDGGVDLGIRNFSQQGGGGAFTCRFSCFQTGGIRSTFGAITTIGTVSTRTAIDAIATGRLKVLPQPAIASTLAGRILSSSTLAGSSPITRRALLAVASAITSTSGVDSWTRAQSDAQVKGGYLVTITSSLENMLATAAALEGGAYRGAWIGIYRDKDNASQPYAWKFAAGSPEAGRVLGIQGNANGTSGGSGVTAASGYYQNFGTGEPNGGGTGGEYAGQFFGVQALWNDLSGGTGYSQNMSWDYSVMGYVMEKNLNPSRLTINAGGNVTMSGAVGSN